jgi:hypothetical protein
MTKEAKENIVKSPSGRVKRTPVGVRNVLSVKGLDPDFHYRIVNDDADRIQQFLDAGYELVPADAVTVGDKRINAPAPEGSVRQVSVGGGQKAFVMRIPNEFYEEDQKAKLREVDSVEAATKQKALNGTYGTLEISRD